MSTGRVELEVRARSIAALARRMVPKDVAWCVLMWGPDNEGQQWRTYVHNVAPAQGVSEDTPECRRVLARELRAMADVIESRADVPPGVMGRG